MMITAQADVAAVIDIPGSVPLLSRRSQAGTVRRMRTPMTIGGHLDVAPTILSLLGVEDQRGVMLGVGWGLRRNRDAD